MGIYTKSGDSGKCSLFSGERVLKCNDRIHAIGEVDELNSSLGVLKAILSDENEGLVDEIEHIQKDLFDIGARLATSPNSPSLFKLEEIHESRVASLEHAIDRMQEELPTLKNFVLPGGHVISAHVHMARSICRRAERRTVCLSKEVELGNPPKLLKGIISYLNRLSDYLFVFGIYCNQKLGVTECFWKKTGVIEK
jgi:cob(I)alamin adenosyltransferase